MLVAAVGVLIFLIAPPRSGSSPRQARESCLSNLGRIGQAIHSYLSDNDNRWPYVSKLASAAARPSAWPTLPVVLTPYVKDHREVFRCPADHRRLESDSALLKKFPARTTYFETEGTSYEWWFGEAYGGKKVGEETLSKAGGFGMGKADQPLLSDFEPFHRGDDQGAVNTLNADLKPRTSRARAAK